MVVSIRNGRVVELLESVFDPATALVSVGMVPILILDLHVSVVLNAALLVSPQPG